MSLRSLKSIVTSLLFMFILTSCTLPTYSISTAPDDSNDFIFALSKMVNDSYEKIKMRVDPEEVILVTDFVNIDKLRNHSKLGFLLSETLKNELSAKNIIIKEIELSKNFKIGKRGFTVLSRNTEDIDTVITDERFAMVGTYSITNKRLILFVKLIDIQTGNILSSSSRNVIIDKEISRLEYSEKTSRDIYQPLTL